MTSKWYANQDYVLSSGGPRVKQVAVDNLRDDRGSKAVFEDFKRKDTRLIESSALATLGMLQQERTKPFDVV